MADPVTDYTILEGGFLFGDWHEAGGVIKLTDKQARRFVDEGRISLPEPKKAAPKRATNKSEAAE